MNLRGPPILIIMIVVFALLLAITVTETHATLTNENITTTTPTQGLTGAISEDNCAIGMTVANYVPLNGDVIIGTFVNFDVIIGTIYAYKKDGSRHHQIKKPAA